MSDAPPPQKTSESERPKPAPNFAARRMLVTTAAITAIVAFAVVGWQAVSSDDDNSLGTASDWDEIAIVDRGSGDIVILDDNVEPDRTILGLGRVEEVHTVGDRIALVGVSQIVLLGGDDEPTAIAIDRGSTVTPVRTEGGLDLVVGRATGGGVQIIDVRSREVLDVGALAGQADPLLFAETARWAADGSAYAIADAASFQTILVRDGADEAKFFPSQPVALDGDRVATSQIVGAQADVGLFDDDRNSKARVPTKNPAGGIIADGTVIMVSIKGEVSTISDGDVEAQSLGSIAVPSGGTVVSVDPSFDGRRLVITGDVFQAVIDLEGNTLFTTTFTAPITIDRPDPSWTCLPVGGDRSFHSLVSLETGEQLADLSGVDVTGWASDGCTVIGERGDVTEVISAAGITSIGRVRSATLGPDGRTVVRTTTSGDTQVLRIDDDLGLGEPIDISTSVAPNAIVAFLD